MGVAAREKHAWRISTIGLQISCAVHVWDTSAFGTQDIGSVRYGHWVSQQQSFHLSRAREMQLRSHWTRASTLSADQHMGTKWKSCCVTNGIISIDKVRHCFSILQCTRSKNAFRHTWTWTLPVLNGNQENPER